MDANKPLTGLSVLVAGALVLGGGVASGGAVWYFQDRAITAAEDRAAEAAKGAADLERRIDGLEADLASATAALNRRVTDTDSGPAPVQDPSPSEDAKPAEDEKRIAYVVKAIVDGEDVSLVLDYAEMLTGPEAAAAHKADGLGEIDGEQFYIRNVNKKQRTLQVDDSAKVVVWSWFPETEDVAAKEIALDRFAAAMRGGSSTQDRLAELPYWFTIHHGRVERIEEQFLP